MLNKEGLSAGEIMHKQPVPNSPGTYSMFIPFMLALRALPLSRKKTPVHMGHNWRIHEGRVMCDMWIPSTESLPYGGRAGLDRPFSPALLNSNPAACALLISRLPQDETLPGLQRNSF